MLSWISQHFLAIHVNGINVNFNLVDPYKPSFSSFHGLVHFSQFHGFVHYKPFQLNLKVVRSKTRFTLFRIHSTLSPRSKRWFTLKRGHLSSNFSFPCISCIYRTKTTLENLVHMNFNQNQRYPSSSYISVKRAILVLSTTNFERRPERGPFRTTHCALHHTHTLRSR
jgi:hypothetical protein